MTQVTLDIFSDPVCPWCMIGKANLDRALEQRPGHPFRIEWHPFQLNPDLPPGGVDRRDYLEAKFGGQARAVEIYAQVMRAAEAAGVDINLDRMAVQPNTLDAHRLIHWAGIEGRQNAVVAALFRAYFRDGRDIGDAAVLAGIAAEAGMEGAMVARLLATDADRDAIAARDSHARQRGVNAVPTFLVANQYVVSGAQPPAFWLQVIDELAAVR
ncbi:DsbA family oxidoreductase [Ruixingdingia sedimenti]|uniref:DsbA family oxidoreductase n=1 Tax=Ruixingdingia sedimenti TaxID=3073604 RepID=A0ABU1F8K3_9RHOB|nr:DsbA family oxidoreductase [Xinfangfangia sp. LG-4]MDR5652933.1 DsbA family oxidoreductase [Xinfangfangia sp. LG-4]